MHNYSQPPSDQEPSSKPEDVVAAVMTVKCPKKRFHLMVGAYTQVWNELQRAKRKLRRVREGMTGGRN